MAISKVVFGNETLMDITDSSVTEENLLEGIVAYGADGERIVGMAKFDSNTISGNIVFAEDVGIQTTNSASVNSTALNAQNNTGKTIVFSKGVYTIGTCTLTGLNLKGLNGARLNLSGLMTWLRNVTVDGFTINGNIKLGTDETPCTWSRLKKCYIVGTGTQIELYRTWSCAIQDCVVQGENAIHVSNVANAFNVSDTVIENNTGYAVKVTGVEVGGLYFNNCVIEGNGQEILLESQTGYVAIYFRDCYFEDQTGAKMLEANSPVTSVSFEGGSYYPSFIQVDAIKNITIPNYATIAKGNAKIDYVLPRNAAMGYSFLNNPNFSKGIFADWTKELIIDTKLNATASPDVPWLKSSAESANNLTDNTLFICTNKMDLRGFYIIVDMEMIPPSGVNRDNVSIGFRVTDHNGSYIGENSTKISYLKNTASVSQDRMQLVGYVSDSIERVIGGFSIILSNGAKFNLKGICLFADDSKITNMLINGESGTSTQANITIDSELSATSTNPVQNKAINEALKTILDSIPKELIYEPTLADAETLAESYEEFRTKITTGNKVVKFMYNLFTPTALNDSRIVMKSTVGNTIYIATITNVDGVAKISSVSETIEGGSGGLTEEEVNTLIDNKLGDIETALSAILGGA